MLKKSERMKRSRFTERPLSRRSFIYGSIVKLSGPPSAAVVVSKKVSRTAPARNKLKRRVYSILRPLVRGGHLKGSTIVYPNKAAITATFQNLKQELEKCLGVNV